MPNIKSAKKRVKTSQVRNLRNKSIKSNLKTTVKKATLAIENNDANAAEAAKLAIKKIDQAAAKGVMHKNTAARRKSAIARKLNNA
ncbi:MAG: 30S ribosomal protein S20 [Clostridia bacterium]|nr:30S ribosomal protein S20 [Clostridia bacterium]MBQ9993217.1 30S ribosomal protein S20 [Clostridia bacterium]